MNKKLSRKRSMAFGLLLLLATMNRSAAQTADALAFGGTDAYVTFGPANGLGLSTFTLETWFRRDGAGQTAYTGTGGVDAIPLVTKGRSEADGGRVDMNYFLGIDGVRGVLVADFEDRPFGTNHPIFGVTVLRWQTWYHAAVTYDGSKWRLYLNGVLEAELDVNQAPRNNSLQHAALATALDSLGAPEGFFDGALDEVRIWNHARPAQQIADGMRTPIPTTAVSTASGLTTRWGLNDGIGNEVFNSVGQAAAGTLRGTNWRWTNGMKFVGNRAPVTPTLSAPGNGASGVATTADLRVQVADPDGDNLIVTAYGRVAGTRGADFSLIALPDTQYYTASVNGGSPALFTSQTQWIVQQRAALNIAYVAQLGDIVENGDNLTEWSHADAALRLLEDPLTTGLRNGLPYGVAAGNHDQVPLGVPSGNSTFFYNQFFGSLRFRARDYYGGRSSGNQDNHYQLFSAAGMDFLVLYFEYDENPNAKVLAWADALLKSYPQRSAIVVCHSLLEVNGMFTPQGQAVYEKLKNNPNLFLMLCGHNHGESWRQDTFNGRTVYTLLADFQNLANGGDAWLRWLQFSPANNRIRVQTYSPTLDLFDRNPISQFDLAYNMEASGFGRVGTNVNVASGTSANLRWAALRPTTEYEWYATVSDGFTTTTSPRWKFRTGAN
jgi:Concanavalin A-like lectin/glucanases superfamily/Calcineurin-like phosphoesterase